MIFRAEDLWRNASDCELHTCGGDEQKWQRGDRICAKQPWSQTWKIGIVTDVFVAPVTEKIVYVIGGEGYYAEDVTDFVTEPEPQSLRVAP
jgi:hypothetical protein